jgi:hypothetical protein
MYLASSCKISLLVEILSFYAAYVFIKMEKPAAVIHDSNASSSVNRRMMAGVLGGGAVATSTSAVRRCSGGCGLTTRFPSRLAPPHQLLPVHTTTVFTLSDEMKVKTYCLLL